MQNDIVRQPPKTDDSAPAAASTPVPAVKPVAPTPAPEKNPAAAQPQQQVPPKKKSDKPTGVIVAAIVLCLGLAGIAIYGGLSGSETKTAKPEAVQQQAGNSESNSANADVDSAVADSDGLQGDVPDLEPEVTDQALGL